MIWIIFAMGIANFYFHRAVMEGREAVFVELSSALKRFGWGYGTYALEFAILVAALWFARGGSLVVLLFYGLYTAINVGGYFMLRIMGGR